MKHSKRISLILGPILFILLVLFFKPKDLSPEGIYVLAATIWIATWWVFEAVPISVTALLPIVLFPLTGALSINATTSSYGHKYVFLYLGGFFLAIAIERWHLHRRIALNIIKLIGSDLRWIIFGFMTATAFLSMWISNTATAVMMLPIGLAIANQTKDNPHTPSNEHEAFGKALMLGIAYASSIGGMATLIGTPPNLVLAGILKETYGIEISFAQWIKIGLPLSIILLYLCWKYLTSFAFDIKRGDASQGKVEIVQMLKEQGKITIAEKRILIIFVITAAMWMTRSYLQMVIPKIDDTIIAIMSGILLFVVPAGVDNRSLLTWEEAVKIPWGVIILFGGGMALAEAFTSTGLALWIGNLLSGIEGLPELLLVLVIVGAVNFLTEITSNLATTAMLLPILAPMAVSLGLHPYILLVAATLAASCAFMLPAATPPNAVVFGSGYLRVADMFRTGIWMNIVSICLITLLVYFLMPLLWGIDVNGMLN